MANAQEQPDPLVERLVVEEGGKVLIVHTLIGDVHINRETIEASKRKVWRPLASFAYPSQQLEHDLRGNYPCHLILQLHKTFGGSFYTTFTGIVDIEEMTLKETQVTAITLTTNQATYVGALRNAVKLLWDEKQDRRALQDAMNAELQTLYASWSIQVGMSAAQGPVPYEFVYDPEVRRIVIGPYKTTSTAPSEYPDKATTTRELLQLLAALRRSHVADMGDLQTILHSYPLAKLFIDVMDQGSIDLDRVRINAHDVEEWDYVNPAVDVEFNQSSKP